MLVVLVEPGDRVALDVGALPGAVDGFGFAGGIGLERTAEPGQLDALGQLDMELAEPLDQLG